VELISPTDLPGRDAHQRSLLPLRSKKKRPGLWPGRRVTSSWA